MRITILFGIVMSISAACGESAPFEPASSNVSQPVEVEHCPGEDIECLLGIAFLPPGDYSNVLVNKKFLEPFPPLEAVEDAADTLTGTLDIQDGRAAYALPLQLPIGINKLVPEVSLSYGSTRENGILGVGWQLAGFSRISRCPRNTSQDASAGPILDTSADRFCLDGKRLVAIQGAYGADGTEYRTEMDSFVRVFTRGPWETAGVYNGPTAFEVWSPDGRIHTYDVTISRGDVRRAWAIGQSRDRFNNTINFTYTTSYCEPPVPGPPRCFSTGFVPKEIQYGSHLGNGSSDPEVPASRTVRFVYSTDRPDRGSTYERGLARVIRHRLESIELVVGAETAWSYKLAYDVTGPVSRLSAVRRCSGATVACTPPTRFTYDTTAQATTRTTVQSNIAPHFGNGPRSAVEGRTIVFDHNGDGNDDVMFPRHASPNFLTYRILHGLDNGRFGSELNTQVASGRPDPSNEFPCFSQDSVQDYNRDGKDDLIDLCMNPMHGYRVFISTPTGFTTTPLSFLPSGYKETPLKVADFDGDGWFDIMHCTGRVPGSNYVLYRNRGDTAGFFPGRAMPSIGRDCDHTITLQIDTDGDGVVNLMRPVREPYQEHYDYYQPWEVAPPWQALVITPTTATWTDVPMSAFPPKWTAPSALPTGDVSYNIEWPVMNGTAVATPFAPFWQLKPLDYNGDGLTDLLTFQNDAPAGHQRVALYVNTGAGFNRVPEAFGSDYTLDHYAFYRATVVDWDADGRQDLLVPVGMPTNTSPSTMVLFRSARSGRPFTPVLLGGTLYKYSVPVSADVDGDGDAEILVPETETSFSIIRGATHVAQLLTEVVDGLGKREVIHYAPLERDAYKVTSSCITDATHCLRRVWPLVAKTELQKRTVSNGVVSYSQVRSNAFAYEDYRAGLHARGGLGFGRIAQIESDPDGEIANTSTTFDNATFIETFSGTTARRFYPNAGQALRVTTTYGTVKDLTDQPLVRQKDVQSVFAVLLSTDKQPFVATVLTNEQSSEGPPGSTGTQTQRVIRTSQFDGYGNALVEHAHSQALGTVATRTSTSSYQTDGNSRAQWRIRCLSTRSVASRTYSGAVSTGEKIRSVQEASCIAPRVPTRVEVEPASGDPSLYLDVTFEYDRFGNVILMSARDAHGQVRTTSYTYDPTGLTQTSSTDSTLTTQTTFDLVHGGLLSEVAPTGAPVTITYDDLGRMREIIEPDGKTSFTYDMTTGAGFDVTNPEGGRLRVRRVAEGDSTTEVIVDALGRIVQTRSSGFAGQVVTQEQSHDYAGRVLYQSDPHLAGNFQGGKTWYEYDRLGRVRFERRDDESAVGGVAVTQFRYGPAWQASQTSWDTAAKQNAYQVVQRTSPSGAVELRVHDHNGNVLVERDALGGVTQNTYGPFGLRTNIKDAAGNLTRFEYDVLGRQTAVVDPNTGFSQTSYDAFDLPISVTRSNGDVSQFKYDTLGRLVERTDADGTQIIEYGTTGVATGQITKATTKDVLGAMTSQLIYDYWPAGMGGPSGKPRTVTRTMGGATFATRLDYDQWGRPITIHYPPINGVQFAVSNIYDPHGHLIEVKNSSSATSYWKLYSADQGYRISHEKYGNNTETRWSYQPHSGRVSSVVTSSDVNGTTEYKQKLALAYDARGELLSRTDDIDNARSRRYEHDPLGRLTRVSRQHGTGASTELDAITYNGIGNITSRSSVGIYAYNAGTPNAVSAAGTSTYAYDVLGNQVTRTGPAVSGGLQQITYSAFGMPTRISTGVAPQQSVQNITYDANHQRAYTSTGAGEKIWHVAELYELRETPGVGLEHTYRVYGPDRVVAEVATRQAGAGTPIQSTATRYVHPDVNGSPDLLTDQTGAVVARPLFDHFGKSVGSPPNVVTGFTGHRQTELGLIDMRGRYYDPTIGRFLTPDPMTRDSSASQALNRYSYVLNRPLALTDPTGWNPDLCISNGGSGQCGDTQLEPDDLRLEEVAPEADPSPQGRADPEAAGVTTTNFSSGVAGAQPWQLWVGNQLHRRIQDTYREAHLTNIVYTDKSIARIVRENVPGQRHLKATTSELRKRPDIYNASLNHLYEIKSAAQLPMAGPTAILYAAIMTRFGLVPQLGPSSEPGTQGGLVLNGRAYAFWSPHDGVIIYLDVTPPRPPPPAFFRYTTRAELGALRSYIKGAYVPSFAGSPAAEGHGMREVGILGLIGYVGFKIAKTAALTLIMGPPGTFIGLSPVGG